MTFDYNPPAYENFDWHDHYQQYYGGTGMNFTEAEPAYRYGYNLATNHAYRDRIWDEDFEREVRAHWEQENEAAWENIKHFVRHAWDEVRGVFN